MEFQIKAKIDWVGDDGTLDEAVKNEIVERIVKALSKDAIDGVTKAAQKQANVKLDVLISETYESFMDQGITITDQWGEPLRKNIKIRDLLEVVRRLDGKIEARFNEALKEKLSASLLAKIDVEAAVKDVLKACKAG